MWNLAQLQWKFLVVGAALLLSLPNAAVGADQSALKTEGADYQILQYAAAQPAEREVTFEEVIADPENVELNFIYAKNLIRDNQLSEAATVLERILISFPNSYEFRFLYAIVLFRLDQLDEAKIEFMELQGANVPPEVAGQIEDYLARISYSRQLLKVGVTLGAGTRYDSNRNSAPESGQFLFIDFPLDDRTGELDDIAAISFLSVDGRYDLGTQQQDELFGSLNVYSSVQSEIDELSLIAASAEVGGVYRSPIATFTITGSTVGVGLGPKPYENPFFLSAGGNVKAERAIEENLHISTKFSGRHEKFFEDRSDDRSGPRFRFDVSGEYDISTSHRISFGVEVTQKNAEADFLQYTGFELQGSHTFLMERGVFLQTFLAYGVDYYDEPDLFISRKERRDQNYTARVTLGAPVSALWSYVVGAPISEISNLLILLSGEYFRQGSNIKNFEYDNFNGTFLVSKRFEF